MSDLKVSPQDLGIGRLFEVVREAVIVAEAATGRILLWNQSATRIFGYSPTEALELRLEELIPEGHRKALLRNRGAENGLGIGSEGVLELHAVRKGGEEISVEMSFSSMAPVGSAEDSAALFVLAIVCKVTERKRTLDRLAESERRFATVLSNARAYVYRCRNEPGYANEFASDYALDLTGYPPEDLLVGGPVCFGDLIVEEDKGKVWEGVQKALARGEGFELRYTIRRRDGVLRKVEEYGQGIYGEGGEVVALEGIVYDVTERERAVERLSEAEERYRTLVERIPAIVYIEEINGRMTTLYDSPQIDAMLGYPQDKHLDDPDYWMKIIHPDDRERVEAEERHAGTRGESFSQEYRVVAADGRVVWVRDDAVIVRDGADEALYLQGFIFDITERKEAEERLQDAEARYRALVEQVPVVIYTQDIEHDGAISYISPRIEEIMGYSPQEYVRDPDLWVETTHPEDRERVLAEDRRVQETGDSFGIECRKVTRDGRVIWVRDEAVLVRTPEGKPLYWQGIFMDITERKVLEEQLEYQALHDSLTGLPNRALFMDRLEHAVVRARRRAAKLAVLFMDLDDFKVINDSLGHEAGDRLLVAVAERLRACLRPEDTAARLGGDEFTILLEDLTGVGGAVRAVERITEALQTAFVLGRREVFITASFGIALWEEVGQRPADLLRNADQAMYRAKHAGKARYDVFEEVMNARALERLELENDLRRALERRELALHYQPVVTLDTGKVMGFEALVRWNRPEHGLLTAEEFAPLAEDTGLIVPMGRWVIQEACRQAREWRQRYPGVQPPTVFVNLSAKQLQDADLAHTVARTTRQTGLDPRSLELEITEGTAMGDAAATAAVLEELKALGVRVAIDDFGTGYSSLSYLERFPVDTLKIDHSFVANLGRSSGPTVLVKAMIDLAHTLGLKVIAEGVETGEQLQRVRELGCDMAQGFHLARPLPGAAAGDLLETGTL